MIYTTPILSEHRLGSGDELGGLKSGSTWEDQPGQELLLDLVQDLMELTQMDLHVRFFRTGGKKIEYNSRVFRRVKNNHLFEFLVFSGRVGHGCLLTAPFLGGSVV